MMESSIVKSHQDFYIPTIQKPAFHLPYVNILGTRHCGNTCPEDFKGCTEYQDVLCHQDYAQHAVSSFAYQIQSEYYGGNRYVPIKGISLKHFSATDQ